MLNSSSSTNDCRNLPLIVSSLPNSSSAYPEIESSVSERRLFMPTTAPRSKIFDCVSENNSSILLGLLQGSVAHSEATCSYTTVKPGYKHIAYTYPDWWVYAKPGLTVVWSEKDILLSILSHIRYLLDFVNEFLKSSCISKLPQVLPFWLNCIFMLRLSMTITYNPR